MKKIIKVSVFCLAAVLLCNGAARADDTEPVTPTVPVLATAAYVDQAYLSLADKKQNKLSDDVNAGSNIAIDDESGKINLDLTGVDIAGIDNVPEDGIYVLTATITNGVVNLKWENITREVQDSNIE